jgi:tetratricopeptide (TPR) repeat protein
MNHRPTDEPSSTPTGPAPRPTFPSPSDSKTAHPAAAPLWPTLALVAVCAGLAGSLSTWFVLRNRLVPAGATAAFAPAGAPAGLHHPPVQLIAGLAPAEADRALGHFHYDRRQWDLAIRHYEAAIRQGLEDADLRTDLGNAYRFTGRFEAALAQYRLAQRLDPAHEPSVFNEGGLHLEGFRDPTAAIAAWEEYLRRFPEGRHAAAARQLLEQTRLRHGAEPAGARASAPEPPATPLPANDPNVERLLRLTGERPAGHP